MNEQHDFDVMQTKEFRQDLDSILQRIKGTRPIDRSPGHTHRTSDERSTAIYKIQEAIMWLGMDLKAQNTPNPYPESKNPENTIISPTADGLTL